MCLCEAAARSKLCRIYIARSAVLGNIGTHLAVVYRSRKQVDREHALACARPSAYDEYLLPAVFVPQPEYLAEDEFEDAFLRVYQHELIMLLLAVKEVRKHILERFRRMEPAVINTAHKVLVILPGHI